MRVPKQPPIRLGGNEETPADVIRQLKEATREVHEAIQEPRAERKKLEALKSQIREIVESAVRGEIETEIQGKAEIVMAFQKVLEGMIEKRFDDFMNGPLADLEKLIRELHEVHKNIPLSQMMPLPENPLFKSRTV